MNRPTFHVCIATGQNLPNLIPALQLDARRVAIIETPKMKTSAQNLKTALAAHGIEIERHPFDDSTPERIRASASALATKLGEQALVFNFTGGHKLMTLALSDEMRIADELHLLYCDTQHDRLDWLSPHAVTEPLDDLLTVEDFLLTQGYRINSRGERDGNWANEAQQRETLTRKLGDEADKLARFFGTLNQLADRCLQNEPDGPFQFEQEFEFAPDGRNADILKLAQKHDLLSWDGDNRLVFKGEAAARYFRGGWLEEYVWIKLRGLRPHDWSVNLKSQTLSQTPNEYDALVAHRNRLLLIECKTTRFGRDGLKDASYVYKLAQLAQQTGGSMSSSLLLSARPVSEDVRQRARDSHVDILAAKEVKTLPDYLRRWMQG